MGLDAKNVGSNSSEHEKYCSQLATASTVLFIALFIIGVVILLILAFTKRRVNVCQGCCNGRPGLVVPLDILSMPRHRWVYALIFGLMSTTFLTLVFGGINVCGSGGTICKAVLSPILVALLVCLLYAPLFVCVDPPHFPLLGHILGLIYLTLFATLKGVEIGQQFEKCTGETDSGLLWASLMENLPIFVFLFSLLAWFICRIIIDIANLSDHLMVQGYNKNYYITYVKWLFARANISSQHKGFLYFIWPYEKGFKYPLKFLGPMVVAVTLLFKLMYATILLAALFDSRAKPSIQSFLEENTSLDIRPTLNLISGTLIAAPFISSALCLFLILHMARSVHIHMNQMARGQFKISVDPQKHFWKLAASLSYFGHQIGYFVWAWLIYYGLILILVTLGKLIQLLTAAGYGEQIFTPVVGLVWLGIVVIIRALSCKFVFLNKSEPDARVLSITNRNVFNWFSYFFFIYDSILGFMTAIVRLLLSLLFGTILLFRLDRNVMMPGFQFADFGHWSYLGFLYVEHTHNNPIVHVFVALLMGFQPQSQHWPAQESVTQPLDYHDIKSETSPLVACVKGSTNSTAVKDARVGKEKVRNRWLVAYTLLRNPSLRPLRGHQLQWERQQKIQRDGNGK